MVINIKSLTSEIGTPFYIVDFNIKDGSVLLCEMKMALRNEWFTKSVTDMNVVELQSVILKQLHRYSNSFDFVNSFGG